MNKLIKATTAAFLLMTAVSSSLASGKPEQQPPRMTGQQLIDNFQAGADVPLTSRGFDSTRRTLLADGYLAGVADAFHGSAWCSDGSVKRDEINSAVIFSLKELDKGKLSSPAASLVKASLSKLYPCKRFSTSKRTTRGDRLGRLDQQPSSRLRAMARVG